MKRAHEFEESTAKKARIESDLCNTFPAELLVQIFKIIPQEYRRYSGVCKHWNNVSANRTIRNLIYAETPATWLTRSEIVKWTNCDKRVWAHISHFKLSIEFIHDYAEKLDWAAICLSYPLTQSLIEQYKNYIAPHVDILITWGKLRFNCESIKDIISWDTASKLNYGADSTFIRCNYMYLNWTHLCQHTKMGEKLMRDLANYLEWNVVSQYQDMSISFMIAFKDKINWPVYLSREDNEQNIIGLCEDPEIRKKIISILYKRPAAGHRRFAFGTR